MSEQIIKAAKELCERVINRALTGRTAFDQAYFECKVLRNMIIENEQGDPADHKIRGR